MKSALLVLSILFGFVSPKSNAQDIVQQYPFHNLERDSPQSELVGSLNKAMRIWDDSLGSIWYAYSDVENTRYHLFHITGVPENSEEYIEGIEIVRDGKLVLIRLEDKKHRYQQWNTPYSAFYRSYDNPMLRWDRSTIFLHNGTPYIKVYHSVLNDFTNKAFVQFFAAQGDSLSSLGSIPLYDNDDASGFRQHELYDGELLPFASSSDGVNITLNRSTFSTYPIEYLLTPDSLTLVKDHKPEFHIAKEEAENQLNAIFEDYYSEYWKKNLPSIVQSISGGRFFILP